MTTQAHPQAHTHAQPPRTSRTQGRRGGVGGVGTDFLVAPASLDRFSLSGDRGGVVLGSDQRGGAVQVHLFRPEPSRLAVVGGLYLARQLVLRAAATGARVVVATGRPPAWTAVLRAFDNVAVQVEHPAPEPVQIRGLEPASMPRATQEAPVLVVQDSGAVPQELYPSQSPWQATVYVLPYLHPQVGTNATDADLVLLQRLPVVQAQLAGRLWRLPPAMAYELSSLSDDEALAVGTNLWLPLRLVTTPQETALLGPVRRGD